MSSGFHAQQARSLLARLDGVAPLSATMPSVPAASVPLATLRLLDRHLGLQRERLRRRVEDFLNWIEQGPGRFRSTAHRQRRWSTLKLAFNSTLDQIDIFSDVLSQRAEHEVGLWLAGLDALATDALETPGELFRPPPLMTYLDRGHGAAIRRVRTRLPGGADNPVAIIRLPRERMVGSGIGSSLVHETGHQASALLGLVDSVQADVIRHRAELGPTWPLWKRWVSEVIADLWASGHLGVTATVGLMGVVSLPRAFVFGINIADPHPFPWIRVLLSLEVGQRLYPDPQWAPLARLWRDSYPLRGLSASRRRLIDGLERSMTRFVDLLVAHRARSLGGLTLGKVVTRPERTPRRLRAFWDELGPVQERLKRLGPVHALAAVGQARADERLSATRESQWVGELLRSWALYGPARRRRLRLPSRVGALAS